MAENIQVAIRIKPGDNFIKKEINNSISIGGNQFIFDNIFYQDSTQEEIFNKMCKNVIQWVSQGYNSTVFAYGCSGSGKTFTLFGGENEKKGIIPRACESLFFEINNNQSVMEAELKCSFFEIYREKIQDLLNPLNGNLKIRQDISGGVFIQGITEKHVYSPEEILSIIKSGANQRSTASTLLNNTSSRSHAILTLTLTQKMIDKTEIISKLNLIDLAGSENIGKSEVQGVNLLETQTINKSLSCLGNVINALTEKKREHIPYRDSKLTYLLQDSLGGNSKTVLIATINPHILYQSETINTLKFAKRAKDIKNDPKINKNESYETLVKMIELLTEKNKELEEKCKELQLCLDNVTKDSSQKEKVLFETKLSLLEEKYVKDKTYTNSILKKEKKLSREFRLELTKEKLKNYVLNRDIEQYEMLFQTFKENSTNPELLVLMVNKGKIVKSCLDCDNDSIVSGNYSDEEI